MPLGLEMRSPDANSGVEPLASFEGAAQRPVTRALPLGTVAETMSATRGEGESTRRQVELGDAITRLRADEPPAPAAEGLGRGLQLNPVIRVVRLAGRARRGVVQTHPAAILSEVSLIAD